MSDSLRPHLGPPPSEEAVLEQAASDCSRHLAKPIDQLVSDIYATAAMGSPGGLAGGYPVQATLHCNKLMVAMMAKVTLTNDASAKANDVLQRRLYWLTVAVTALTVVATVFAGIQAAGVIAAWTK